MSMIFWYLPIAQAEFEKIEPASPEAIEKYFFDTNREHVRNIDKSWAVVHSVLMTGISDINSPLGLIMSGGAVVGCDEDGWCYRYLNRDELGKTADAFSKVDRQGFLMRFDSKDPSADEHFPGVWEGVDELRDYFCDMFMQLRNDLIRS